MSKTTTGPACLSSELQHEAALSRPLPAPAAQHLETCADCQAAVAGLRRALQEARDDFQDTLDQAMTQFRMPALPRRQPRHSGLWSLVATPIPAYAAAAALMVLLLPLALLRPGPDLELGGEKGLGLGLSAEESFARIYAPDPQDPAALSLSYTVISQYATQHPEDLAAQVKLVEVCDALLKCPGWERPELTRAAVEAHLAAARAAVARGLSQLPEGGRP